MKIFQYIKRIWTLLIFLSGVAVISCYDDKGNYDYLHLKEIVIDTSGLNIKRVYSVKQFEEINISPRITQNSGDNSNLKYEWYVYVNSMETVNRGKPQLLSEEPGFNQQIILKPGSYVLLLTVTDNTTGVKEHIQFIINVTGLLKSGWLVFYEDENNESDVGIINDKILDPSITENQVACDLYYRINGRKLAGSPLCVSHLRLQMYPPYQPSIYLITDQESVRVDDQSLSLFGKATEWFFVPPKTDKLQLHTVYNYCKEVVINDGRVHYSELMVFAAATEKKIPAETYGKYYAEPWISTIIGGVAQVIFYDRLTQKFMYAGSASVGLGTLPVQTNTTAFDANNVGMEMLYMEGGFANTTLAMMKASDSKKYVLECNFTNLNNVAVGKYLFSGYPGSDDAKYFTFGNKGKVFLYANDQKVYSFDYASQTISTTEQWSVPAGEAITCMKLFRGNALAAAAGPFPYNPNTSYMLGMESKLIFIATYNEATKEGFVYRYNINETTGTIDRGSEVKYTGFGKVKRMAHKSPNNNS